MSKTHATLCNLHNTCPLNCICQTQHSHTILTIPSNPTFQNMQWRTVHVPSSTSFRVLPCLGSKKKNKLFYFGWNLLEKIRNLCSTKRCWSFLDRVFFETCRKEIGGGKIRVIRWVERDAERILHCEDLDIRHKMAHPREIPCCIRQLEITARREPEA